MSKLITTNDLQDILNEALPTPRYGGVQTASWTADSSSANNVKLTDSLHLTAGTYVITVKFPNTSATLLTAITYGTGTLLDSYCIGQGDAYSSHSYVINIPSEMDVYVVSATSTAIRYTYKESGGLRAIQIAESKASSNEADYIVEQGTSGIWTYRKWNSGAMEAWGNSSDSFAMTSGINNYQYYGAKSYSVSSLGFTAIHNIQITGGGGGAYFASKVESFDTSAINMSARASNSYTGTLTHWFYVKGTWK